MENTVYHDRVRQLLESAQKLQLAVQQFANMNGVSIDEPIVQPTQPVQSAPIQPVPVVPVHEDFKQDVSTQFDEVKAHAENVNDIVNGIDIDALLQDADLGMGL